MSMELSIRIRAQVEEAQRALAKIKGDVSSFGQAASSSGDVANGGFTRTAQGVRSISEQLETAKKQLLAFFGVQQALRGAGAVKDVVVEFEKLSAQLKTFTGSKEAAAAIFERIQQFATETPYQLTEVTNAWIMLRARGIDPTNETLRGIGNVAAAMGKDIVEVTNTALQASVGNLETMRMMGFDVIAQGDKLKITFNGVSQVVEKNAASLIGYFQQIGNTQFGTAMADQMEKLGGALSNVSDNTQKAVKSISDESGLTGAMTKGANATAQWLGELDAREVIDAMRLAVSGLAGVMAMRMTPAVIEQTVHWRNQIVQMMAARAATIAATQEALASARAEAVRTAALLAEAQAEKEAATATSLRGAALTNINVRLASAAAAHTAATTALSAAQARAAASSSLLAGVGRGLLGLLGGWPGVIMGAVTAVGMWVASSKSSTTSTRDWREELLQLRGEMKALEQYQLDKKIRDTEQAIAEMQATIKGGPGFWGVVTGGNKEREQAEAEIGNARRMLYELQAQREKLVQAKATASPAHAATVAAPALDDNALGKDAIERQLKAIERAYNDAQLSAQEYFTRRRDLQLRSLDFDIADHRAALAAMKADDDKGRTKEATEIVILERKRADIKAEAARNIVTADKELQQQLTDIRLAQLEREGSSLDERNASVVAKYQALLARLKQAGNAAGVALVQGQINFEQDKNALDDLDAKHKAIIDAMNAREQQLQREREAGLINELQQREQLNALHQDTAAEIDKLIPAYEQLAESGADPRAARALREVRSEMGRLTIVVSQDALRMKGALQNGLTDTFENISNGTKNLSEAFDDLQRSVAAAFNRLIAENFAQKLMTQFTSASGGSGRGFFAWLGSKFGSMFGPDTNGSGDGSEQVAMPAAQDADIHHTGGIAGAPSVSRRVTPLLFAGAPRYHTGGIAGLKANEVPAILMAGEEVLTRNDPRHMANGGGAGSQVVIYQSFDFSNTDAAAAQRLRAEANNIKRETVAEVMDKMNRGGAMSRASGRRR